LLAFYLNISFTRLQGRSAPLPVRHITPSAYIVAQKTSWTCYVLLMVRKLLLVAVALSLMTSFAFTQQSSDDAVKAVQNLEQYREGLIKLWMNDFGNLGRYRDANAKLALTNSNEDRVVFMGDSITDIWKFDKSFPGKPYVNRGIGGQTTPQMLIRFRPDVIDLDPKVVVILAGTNDISGNTGPMTLAEIEANLKTMAELARLHIIRVVMSSVLPVNNYTERSKMFFPLRPPSQILELNLWIKDYCVQHDCIYLDYFSAMVDDKGMLKADLADDGLHPNDKGYAIMAPLAQKAIEQALQAH
jgi:lysophospholipase L1-like esterase